VLLRTEALEQNPRYIGENGCRGSLEPRPAREHSCAPAHLGGDARGSEGGLAPFKRAPAPERLVRTPRDPSFLTARTYVAASATGGLAFFSGSNPVARGGVWKRAGGRGLFKGFLWAPPAQKRAP